MFLHTWIIRPFNKKSLENKKDRVLAKRAEDNVTNQHHSTEQDQEQSQSLVIAGPKVQRTKDRERIVAFCDAYDQLNQDINQLERESPEEFKQKRKELEKDLSSTKSKQSAIELQKEMDIAKKSNSKKKRTVYAAEHSSEGMYIPAAVGGAVVVSALLKGQHESIVDIEINARKITLTQPLGSIKWKAKTDLLKIDEHMKMSARPEGLFNPDGSGKTYQQMQEIMPVSEEMKALQLSLPKMMADKRARRAANACGR